MKDMHFSDVTFKLHSSVQLYTQFSEWCRLFIFT